MQHYPWQWSLPLLFTTPEQYHQITRIHMYADCGHNQFYKTRVHAALPVGTAPFTGLAHNLLTHTHQAHDVPEHSQQLVNTVSAVLEDTDERLSV